MIERISKTISYILRHNPDSAGVVLDENGWADVKALLAGLNIKYPIDMVLLEKIVAEDKKGRYSFNEDKTKIRANQGHSLDVNPDLVEATPENALYHGTAERFVEAITQNGLLPMGRKYVHLSYDIDAAISVGRRHGKPVVYKIDCRKMSEDGYKFYLSSNGIWLTREVPPQYLELCV